MNISINIDRITGKVTSFPSVLTLLVSVEDNFDISKTVKVIAGQKQKTNEEGLLLYKINLKEDGSYDETTEAKIVTKTEKKEVVNKWTDEDGKEHSEPIEVDEPIEWIENEPVLVDNIVDKTITFAEDPTQFTAEEVLKSKYQKLLDRSSYDFILADIFLNEEDIDLEDKDHSANTGVAIMELRPKGQAKTKSIKLEAAVKVFELLELDGPGVDVYINDVKFVDGKAILSAAADEVVIKFKNTTDKPVNIKSYAIAY